MFWGCTAKSRQFYCSTWYRSNSIKDYVWVLRFDSWPVETLDTIFSLFALRDVLKWPHYNCWNLFVKSCYLLCRRSITTTQLLEGNKFLMDFCKRFAELYGCENCTTNMHLHGHLVECIEDFGPVYAFWCFSYELMNGILGSYPVNNHHNKIISIQLTIRFLYSKAYAPSRWPKKYVEEYLPFINNFTYEKGTCNRKPRRQRFLLSHLIVL